MANIPQWKVGDVLSASKLNAMVDAINELLSNNSIDGSNYITVDRLEEILAGYSDTGHTHDISEIVNAIIPTKMSQLTNDANYADKEYVDDAIANAQLNSGNGESVNLDAYAKKEDIPTKLSELENDSNFATKDELDYNNLTNKPNIPSITGLASESYVDSLILDYTDGKKQRYVTQEEYDALNDEEKNDINIVWNITDKETQSSLSDDEIDSVLDEVFGFSIAPEK